MKLSAAVWTPDDQPKMVLQIAHGMTEHIGRYDKLAEALTAQGVAVAGFDMRGHGRNSGDATSLPSAKVVGGSRWKTCICSSPNWTSVIPAFRISCWAFRWGRSCCASI